MTMAKISESLAGVAATGEEGEQGFERRRDIAISDFVEQTFGQPRALKIAADIERVMSGHAADDADIAGIGPRASIGTAGDSDADPLVAETMADERRLDRADEIVLDPLGLAQREAACRQRRTGERPARDRRELARQPYPVLPQYQLDGWAV